MKNKNANELRLRLRATYRNRDMLVESRNILLQGDDVNAEAIARIQIVEVGLELEIMELLSEIVKIDDKIKAYRKELKRLRLEKERMQLLTHVATGYALSRLPDMIRDVEKEIDDIEARINEAYNIEG